MLFTVLLRYLLSLLKLGLPLPDSQKNFLTVIEQVHFYPKQKL